MPSTVSFRLLGLGLCLALLGACGNDEQQATGEQAADATPAAAASGVAAKDPTLPAAQGTASTANTTAALEKDLAQLGCFACHAIDQKRVGPAYREIAARYRGQADAVDKLVQKVRNGGSGVWGPVPMIAHPHLTEAQLKPLIERLLQLQ